MRYFLLGFFLLVVLVVGLAGFRGELTRNRPLELFPDMDRQPKLKPQDESELFLDGRASRKPVPGTIARGDAWQQNEMNTGLVPGTTNFVEINPVPVTEPLLDRGQERYTIYCAPCHGPEGDGKGVTTQFGVAGVASFHDQRLLEMTDGQYFQTITHGSPSKLMGAYGDKLEIQDRWAVVAYVRALQLSRLATTNDVPAAQLSSLQEQ